MLCRIAPDHLAQPFGLACSGSFSRHPRARASPDRYDKRYGQKISKFFVTLDVVPTHDWTVYRVSSATFEDWLRVPFAKPAALGNRQGYPQPRSVSRLITLVYVQPHLLAAFLIICSMFSQTRPGLGP